MCLAAKNSGSHDFFKLDDVDVASIEPLIFLYTLYTLPALPWPRNCPSLYFYLNLSFLGGSINCFRYIIIIMHGYVNVKWNKKSWVEIPRWWPIVNSIGLRLELLVHRVSLRLLLMLRYVMLYILRSHVHLHVTIWRTVVHVAGSHHLHHLWRVYYWRVLNLVNWYVILW